jgi:hypothetical protein
MRAVHTLMLLALASAPPLLKIPVKMPIKAIQTVASSYQNKSNPPTA